MYFKNRKCPYFFIFFTKCSYLYDKKNLVGLLADAEEKSPQEDSILKWNRI